MNRILIAGGWVLTMDSGIGDFRVGDVLIEDDRVAAVGATIAAADAHIIDAKGHIVMPGLVDTHRHTWQSCMRHRCGDLDSPGYFQEMLFRRGPRYRPEDVYIATLLGAMSALDSGTTTMLDWAHIVNTPEHSDVAISALAESGVRAVFGHGWPLTDPTSWMVNSARGHPEDIRRLRRQYFSSDDGLMTLAMAGRGPEMTTAEVWENDLRLARDLDIRSTIHMGAAGRGPQHRAIEQMNRKGALGSDLTFVHCTTSSDAELKMMADNGVTASLGIQVEQVTPAYGDLPIDRMLSVGIRPSLSSDTETKGAGDLFTQMKLVLSAYRAWISNGHSRAETAPAMLSIRDVLEFATVVGADANGLANKVGSLTPGKQADIITIRCSDLNLTPVSDAVGAVVLGAHAGNVDTVMVAGKIVKRHGKMVGCDLDRLRSLAQDSLNFILGEDKAAASSSKKGLS
jgi:5-methylthioadenosine/S-adenosylhomocysteine deaminase